MAGSRLGPSRQINGPFRALMKSLGIEEEKLVVEGRGVLAEVLYTVDREKWTDIELDVAWEE